MASFGLDFPPKHSAQVYSELLPVHQPPPAGQRVWKNYAVAYPTMNGMWEPIVRSFESKQMAVWDIAMENKKQSLSTICRYESETQTFYPQHQVWWWTTDLHICKARESNMEAYDLSQVFTCHGFYVGNQFAVLPDNEDGDSKQAYDAHAIYIAKRSECSQETKNDSAGEKSIPASCITGRPLRSK
jgi:hypothetical protein